MKSILGVLATETNIYKEQHIKGLQLLSLMEDEVLGSHPERAISPAGRPEYAYFKADFNISHTQNLVICSMAEGKTGCDVEKANRKVSLALTEKFFHPQERAFIEGAKTAEEKQKLFLTLWVLKEAHIKLLGGTIWEAQSTPAFYISDGKILCQKDSGLFYALYEGGGYITAVAFEQKTDRDNLVIKNYGGGLNFSLTAVN